MTIQIIRYSSKPIEKEGEGEIIISPLNAPRTIDDFDINIIDLSVGAMWNYWENAPGMTDSHLDLNTIQKMVSNKKKAIVVYVLPQNIHYTYSNCYKEYGDEKTYALKDLLNEIQKYSISAVIPTKADMPELTYEKTETTISGCKYNADFCFIDPLNVVTKSDKSEKTTTTEICHLTFATTLDITKSNEKLSHFISALFELFKEDKPTEIPAWMENVSFSDDNDQRAIIDACEKQIAEANAKIDAAQDRLKENAKIKSILYTNGKELELVVLKILERLLSCDLSGFEDKKKEDFLIKLPCCTFIGEIKGITSNVKYEHIAQLELHYRGYLDRLVEMGNTETVKQLLIINSFRTKPLDQRDPVNTAQVELALRNKCLIIETHTLLRIYEKFCESQLTSQQCTEVFMSRNGLLSVSDFDNSIGDLDAYKL